MCSTAHHGGSGVNVPWEQHLQLLLTSGHARPAFSLGLHPTLWPASTVGPRNSLLSNCTAFSCSPSQSCMCIHMSPAPPSVWEPELEFNLSISVNVQSVSVPCAYILSIQDWEIVFNLWHEIRSYKSLPHLMLWTCHCQGLHWHPPLRLCDSLRLCDLFKWSLFLCSFFCRTSFYCENSAPGNMIFLITILLSIWVVAFWNSVVDKVKISSE